MKRDVQVLETTHDSLIFPYYRCRRRVAAVSVTGLKWTTVGLSLRQLNGNGDVRRIGPPMAMRLEPAKVKEKLEVTGFRAEIVQESMPRHHMVVEHKVIGNALLETLRWRGGKTRGSLLGGYAGHESRCLTLTRMGLNAELNQILR